MTVVALRRAGTVAICAVAIMAGPVACGSSDGSRPASAAAPSATSANQTAPWNYVMFGDSWPHGSHCNGCRPFPVLYADGVKAKTGHPVTFKDMTTNGGGSASLLQDLQTQDAVRQAAADADIIVISTGANDLEQPFADWQLDSCGGKDHLDCFRTSAKATGRNFDRLLAAIQKLRAGKATAVRVVTDSNEFLSDPGLIAAFGSHAAKDGAVITALQHDAECAAAQKYHDTCVDLRPVLNGPTFDQPQDSNAPVAMQKVADALVAVGLAELGTT